MTPPRDLPMEDKIGQLFWIGFQGTAMNPVLASLLKRVRPGGLILFSRNIQNARQIRDLTDALFGAIRIPPFIALDQEGGRVSRLKDILGPTPAPFDLARRARPEAAVELHASATAAALKSLGFNVNFAPVLDLSGPDPSNGIGDRAFGDAPLTVCRLARVVLEAHLRAGILPVGKHFPGLGSARGDTHLALPIIRKQRALLWREDLLPFRRLSRRLPMIMAGHACYPAFQGHHTSPATLAPEIVDVLLRRRIGFRGLILTDDLEMGAVDQEEGAGTQALRALAAGNDGLMFCGSEDTIVEARNTVLAAVQDGDIDPARIDRSVRRILGRKRRSLVERRRAAFAAEAVERSRVSLASLGGGRPSGFDPTARA